MQSVYPPELLDIFLGLRKRLVSTITRFVKSRAAAEDLVQDTFLRLWERRAVLPEADQLRGYVLRTGRNLAIDFRRRERIVPFVQGVEHLEFMADALPSPEEHVIARQNIRSLADAMAALPPRAREVFVMARIDGMTYVEIGEKLGISPKTVFSHMVVALQRLGDFPHPEA